MGNVSLRPPKKTFKRAEAKWSWVVLQGPWNQQGGGVVIKDFTRTKKNRRWSEKQRLKTCRKKQTK